MIESRAGMRIYTVVDVMRGVAVGAYSFRRLRDAHAYLKRLRGGRDLQEDDVQLFKSTIDASKARLSGCGRLPQ